LPRGNQRRKIYEDERDRKLWLETLGQACEKTGWRIHAWVMMNNHYHLLLETSEANLVAGMKWLQGTYSKRLRIQQQGSNSLCGPLRISTGTGGTRARGVALWRHPLMPLGMPIGEIHRAFRTVVYRREIEPHRIGKERRGSHGHNETTEVLGEGRPSKVLPIVGFFDPYNPGRGV
jgi:REP element-mobilizing transposase RayT